MVVFRGKIVILMDEQDGDKKKKKNLIYRIVRHNTGGQYFQSEF